MHKQTISACLVIYNEEKVLEQCLKSIKPVVNEIIIVHDGKCTDKSLQIAKIYGARIFIRKHIGEAKYHRPFAFKKATGDWILHIDGDEYLSDEAAEEIPNLVKSNKYSAYAFRWPFKISDNTYFTKGIFSRMLRTCLYYKKDLYMIGITHQHPGTYGKICKRPDLTIWHDHDLLGKKIKSGELLRWPKIQARQYLNYDRMPTYNIEKEPQIYTMFRNRVKYPVFFFIIDISRDILFHLKRGLFLSGFRSIKYAFLGYSRIIFFYYYLIKYKHGTKN